MDFLMGANFAVLCLASPENIFVNIDMVNEPDSKTEQYGCVIVQMIEKEVNCLFNKTSKPGPITAPEGQDSGDQHQGEHSQHNHKQHVGDAVKANWP